MPVSLPRTPSAASSAHPVGPEAPLRRTGCASLRSGQYGPMYVLPPGSGAPQPPSARASSRRSAAPSPFQVLPCMQARVLGSLAASFSTRAEASRVWEK